MNKFINASAILKTTPIDVFVCPENTQSVIHSLFVSTLDLEEVNTVTIQVYDASDGKLINIGYNLEVLPKTTLSFDKPINLESSDILKVYSNKNDKLHIFVSILNITPLSL